VRIVGRRGERPALAEGEQVHPAPSPRRAGMTRTPAFGIAVIAPLMLAGAVGASGPTTAPQVQNTDVTPLAAVAVTPPVDTSGPTVVAVAKAPTGFRVGAATTSAPPPAMVVSAPGALRIPGVALSAYRNAESIMATTAPGCGVSWNLLAGIGRIESGHANNGATDSRGTAVNPIYGPALDGSLPGNEIIVASSQLGRVGYARAMGPMQFLPGTWSRYASDGDGDGKADPQNVYDAALAAARYLCSGGLNLRDQSQVLTAILRYNNSMPYARNVLGWAGSYTTGVAPVNLPSISGSPPPIADRHVEVRQQVGLGPDLADADPSLFFRLGDSNVANQLPVPPGPAQAGAENLPLNAPCTIFCIGSNTPAAPAPWTPPWMQPGWTPPWMQPPAPVPAAPGPAGPAPGPFGAPPAAPAPFGAPPAAPAPFGAPVAPAPGPFGAPPAAPAPPSPAAPVPTLPGPAAPVIGAADAPAPGPVA
jgi:membrane-bound lytic murein transglycosylase B